MEAERKEEALAEVSKLEKKLADLEENILKKKEDTKNINDQIMELGKESEERVRIARSIKNKNKFEDEKVAMLEKQLEQAKFLRNEAEGKHDEVMRKIDVVGSKLEQVDLRVSEAESKKSKLEDELKELCISLKAVECAKDKACKKEESYSDKIKVMEMKCQEVEARAESSENAVARLEEEIDRLEGLLGELTTKNKKLEAEMEGALTDLNRMWNSLCWNWMFDLYIMIYF